MPIQPIKRTAIAEEVANHIMELIRRGELQPGEKLPSERELAEQFQVSRVSLREGMRTLAFMNILEIRTGDGTYVSALSPEQLMAPLEFVLSVNDATLFSLLQARQFVEPQLAALAAKLITGDEVRKLNACLDQMLAAGEDYQRISELDVDLHLLIAESARNPFLSRFMASLRYLGQKSRERTIQIPSIREQAQADHERIVAALNARKADDARQAMHDHLKHIENGLRAEIEQLVNARRKEKGHQ